ncbi:MAG: VanZ family protein [Methylococcales bacterium]|nr:VanZ family protein [Methylococcales bacterium]
MQKLFKLPLVNSRYCIILPLLYMVGIFCLSSLPDHGIATPKLSPLAWLSPNVQNFLHIPLYAGLAFLWMPGLGHWAIKHKQGYLWAFLLTLAYGLLDEWHQTFVPGRTGSFTDVASDMVGAIIGLWVYKTWFSAQE